MTDQQNKVKIHVFSHKVLLHHCDITQLQVKVLVQETYLSKSTKYSSTVSYFFKPLMFNQS